MNEHPNAAIIRSAYEAIEKGDVATYTALIDYDIICHEFANLRIHPSARSGLG